MTVQAPIKTVFALLAFAVSAATTPAKAENSTQQPAHCPTATEWMPVHLYGVWQAELEGRPGSSRVLFEKHPELEGSVSGNVVRDGTTALIAGDIDAGEFTLEESRDGQHISATWSGTVVGTSCGKEIRGLWNNPIHNQSYPFVLRKVPGWP